MRAFLTTLILAALAAGCSCARPGEQPDAASFDAGRDVSWAFADANSDSFDDVGPCAPDPPTCSTDDDCILWGARVAPAGTWPVTSCRQNTCMLGVTDCRSGGLFAHCNCSSTAVCVEGQICVSDVFDGPTRCAQACEGR